MLLLFLLAYNISAAQDRVVTGRVVDTQTHQPLSSSSVYSMHSGNGVITDEDGKYTLTISDKTDSIAISMIGYKAQVKAISKEIKQVVNFDAVHAAGELHEVSISVKSKYTRAQLLVRKVIKNKPKHNIYDKDNFKSQVYDKVEIDIKNISEKLQHNRLLKPLDFILNNMDTTTDKQKYLPVYLSETLADFYYKSHPEKERYDYISIKSSGLDNQSILTYIDGLYKKINIYDNLVKLVDINFVSPIADNALSFYNYHINDTLFIDSHRCIQVQFSPIQYGTNTFNGFMWIVDSSYAIKSLVMHMDKSASINFVNKFEITQNFELSDSQQYLPSKNILYIDLNIPAMKMGVIAKKTTLFKSMILNNKSVDTIINKKEKGISTVAVNSADTAFWAANRFEPLSKTENSVYKLMDTLNKIPAVIMYGKIIDVLSSGYYSLGKVDIGYLYNTYTSDRIEGNRFNFGMRTNSTWNDHFRLKGYIGASTKDKKIRYDASALFVLDKKQWSTLMFDYGSDIESTYDHDDELDQNSIFASFLRRIKSSQLRLVNDMGANIYYNKFFTNGFGLVFQAKASELTPYFNTYYTHDNFVPFIILKPGENNSYRTNQVAFTLRYVYKEKFITQHFRRGSLGSNYPIINLTYTKGFKVNSGLFRSDFDYSKWNLSLNQDFSDGRIGQLSYKVQAGFTQGILPILLLDVQKGNDTYYYNPYAFNNMNRYEFATDKYVSVSMEQNFGSFPFNHFPLVKKFKWRSLVTFKGVLGDMSEANKKANGYYDNTIDYHFTIPNKTPYMEVGAGIENIFHLLRIDAVWRVNYLDNPNVPKIGLKGSIQFKF